MGRAIALVGAAVLLSGCSIIFFHLQPCARDPGEALGGLFAALSTGESQSTDSELMSMDDLMKIKIQAIQRFAPDPRQLLRSLGKGNLKKGWHEFTALRNPGALYPELYFEFIKNKILVEVVAPLPPQDPAVERHLVKITRIDSLWDVRFKNTFVEIQRSYSRLFTAEFSEKKYCIMGLTPLGEWEALSELR